MRMQLSIKCSLDVDFLSTLRASFDNFEVSSKSPASLVVHPPCPSVTDPGVRSSSAGVDPHDMLESAVFSQSGIYYFDGHGHERPTFMADVGFDATCSDLVVVCQIDIEDQFFL